MSDKTSEVHQTNVCANCGQPVSTAFCGSCGEKRLGPDDYAFKTMIKALFTSLTNIEGRFPQTLWRLLAVPGELTRAFRSGKRRSFMGPLQFFLVINVVYFFIQPMTYQNTFNTNFRIQYQALAHSPLVRSLVGKEISKNNWTKAQYEQRYNRVSGNLAKALIICMTPMMALLLWGFFYRSEPRFVLHWVCAVHHYSFIILAWGIFISLLFTTLARLDQAFAFGGLIFFSEMTTTLMMLGCNGVYFFFAARRFYGIGRWEGIWKSFGLTLAFLGILQGYRFFLFLATYLSIWLDGALMPMAEPWLPPMVFS